MNYKIDIVPLWSDNYIFLITCLNSKKTICVDPGDGQIILDKIREDNLNLVAIFNTHHHPDHIGGNELLSAQTGCKIYGFKGDKHRITNITNELDEEDEIRIGDLHFLTKHIPGHTTGHIYFFEKQYHLLFCGDTVFSSGCGYLFEGSCSEMFNSIEQIKSLPNDSKIYCAHEYTLKNIEFALTLEPNNKKLQKKKELCTKLRENNQPTIPTTLQIEKETNPFFRTLSRELRNSLGTTSLAYNVDVFTKTRKLKDKF